MVDFLKAFRSCVLSMSRGKQKKGGSFAPLRNSEVQARDLISIATCYDSLRVDLINFTSMELEDEIKKTKSLKHHKFVFVKQDTIMLLMPSMHATNL